MAAAVRPSATAMITWRPRLLGVLAAALALRTGVLVSGVVPFNADEAVVGLMARHILQGERPLFFYGQAYLGSLDAWLVAGVFALFGPSVWAIRVVQMLLFLATLAVVYALALHIYRSRWIAGMAAIFMAIPPVLVTLYTTVSLGGYGELLLIGNLIVLLALRLTVDPGAKATRIPRRWPVMRTGWLLVGFLGGLGFWTFPLIVVYVLPVLVHLVWHEWPRPRSLVIHLLLFAAGFCAGAGPWLWYTATHGLATLAETSGSALPRSAAPALFTVLKHAGYFLLFGLTVVWGLRPPWSAMFLALPMIPFAIAVHLGSSVLAARRAFSRHDAASQGRRLLFGLVVVLVLGYVATPFGADPSGRYFLPLVVPAALFLAETLHWLRLRRRQRRSPWRKWFGQTLALGVIAFNWWGNVQSAASYPPGLTTQFDAVAQVDQRSLHGLMVFLREQGETRGYTNYWVEYPLAFQSQEQLIFEARLPYHEDFRYTTRDSRYAPYARLVLGSPRAAYITTRHAALNQRLRTGLRGLEVSFAEADFGDYHVFYGLSRRVTPDELGLGQNCC